MRRSEFVTFYRSAKDPCYRALCATVADPNEADDLLAEAFSRAWAHWRTVRTHPVPEAWIVRTALNLHRDRWRRSRRVVIARPTDPTAVAPIDEFVDPALLAAIRALPERQREVVALRVLLDLSVEQTAAELDIAPGTVTTHLRRALATLRAQLSGQQPEERKCIS